MILRNSLSPSDDRPNTKDIITFLVTTTQFLSAIGAFVPIIKTAIKSISLKGAAKVMTGYRSRNCKLRMLAFSITDVIIDMIQHQPGGYLFWQALPEKGKRNKEAFRKKIADVLLESFYNSSFLSMLLTAAVDGDGKPRDESSLYKWLLTQVYSDNVGKLYSDWLKASKMKKREV